MARVWLDLAILKVFFEILEGFGKVWRTRKGLEDIHGVDTYRFSILGSFSKGILVNS